MMHLLDNIPSEVYRAYFSDRKSLIAENRINAENPYWEKHPVPRLSIQCVRTLATFFATKPFAAVGLKGKDRALFLSLLSTKESIKITADKIQEEAYWHRCCLDNLGAGNCDVSKHGNSWKRLYCETYVQRLVETFQPSHSDISDVKKGLEVIEPYVKRLEITEMLPPLVIDTPSIHEISSEFDRPSSSRSNSPVQDVKKPTTTHLDFSILLPSLKCIEEFSVCYRVKKCGIDFRWNMFGLTMKDSIMLADGLRSLKHLKSLTIQNSKLNDEMLYEIYDGVRHLTHLSALFFPNNALTDDSIDTLVKIMSYTPVKELDLTNNKIGCEGVKTIAIFLSTTKSKLAKLNLSLNNIREAGCALLCKAIGLNKDMTSLNISSNRLDFESCASIRDMLKLSSSLLELNLACNSFGSDGGIQILDGIKNSLSIRRMDLRLTGCSKDVDLSIQTVLKTNRKKLLRSSTSSSSSLSLSTGSHTPKKRSPRSKR